MNNKKIKKIEHDKIMTNENKAQELFNKSIPENIRSKYPLSWDEILFEALDNKELSPYTPVLKKCIAIFEGNDE